MACQRIVNYVTGNKMKLEETAQILSKLPFTLIPTDIHLPEFQGDPEFIVKEKCLAALKIIKAPVMVEDTCLCFNALDGLPGPYMFIFKKIHRKWFLTKLKTSGDVNFKYPGLYRLLSDWEDKSAYALSLFALSPGDENKIFVFKGLCHVSTSVLYRAISFILQLTVKRLGTPALYRMVIIYRLSSFEISFGEMPKSLKNSLSHRCKALQALQDHFSITQNVENFFPST